jgi:LuxR family maltose regulon positive regulatory protein
MGSAGSVEMSAPLLTTKLHIPPIRPEFVPRPRLIEHLAEGSYRKLTLISAPAGFGKTTLVSEWARALGPDTRVAWLSLDEGDDDLVRFLSYLGAALWTTAGTVDRDALNSTKRPQAHAEEEFLTTLLNEVNALARRVLMVFDDYHLVTAQPIHDALTFLLDHLPDNMHLVIATRADPPLPLARLRARGQLTELRQVDLRFTLEEAAAFLNRVTGLHLSPQDVAALEARTEGWIAGLQMAALSMQGRQQTPGGHGVSAFIQALTGSHRFILDYLVEEVLDQQPPAIQEFLLKTSILDRLTGSLCDAVLGHEEISASANGGMDAVAGHQTAHPPIYPSANSQAVLEYLESANLFIIPLDDERRWYRYHRLFAELLRKRLRQTDPNLDPILHRRASEWCEQQGLVAEAIDYSLATEDSGRAARLIEAAAETTLMRSEVTTLLRWIDQLPAEEVQARPSLCIYHAWALLWSGHPWDVVEARLQDLAGTRQVPQALASGQAASLRGMVALFQGKIPRAAELSRRALDQLPPNDAFLRSIALWNLAISHMADGDPETGIQTLEEVVRTSQQAGNIMVAVMVTCNLAELRMKQGRLRQARDVYHRALDLATDDRGQRLPVAGQALFGLAELSRHWNDLDTAIRYLQEGIELIEHWGEVGAIEGYMLLARVLQAQGNVDAAQEALDKARDRAIRFDATDLDDRAVALQQARLWLAQGKLEATRHWFETQGLDRQPAGIRPDDGEDLVAQRMLKYEHTVLARFWLAQGRPERALELLVPLIAWMERVSREDLIIEGRVLQALALQAKGQSTQATEALQRALSLAEPEGWARIFVDEGERMRSLLSDFRLALGDPARKTEAQERDRLLLYANTLLDAFPDRETAAGAEPMSRHPPGIQDLESQLVEPLSERELEVLGLLAAGMSNPEIADQLYIAVSTVRSHCKNIYGKLNVHRRWDAVRRGQELGLI